MNIPRKKENKKVFPGKRVWKILRLLRRKPSGSRREGQKAGRKLAFDLQPPWTGVSLSRVI